MAAKGKRIGFVDYKLDNYHADVFLEVLRKYLRKRGFQVAGCFALDEADGRAWAAKNDVPYFDCVCCMDDHVDYYMVLAPSNPELHLDLCRLIFPFGKPTYVDKTFAPDSKTATKIFALADRCRAKIQTTSALRYSPVQEYVKTVGGPKVRHMIAFGGGRSFGEYAIHPTELVVSCMGPDATRLMRRGNADQSQLLIDFSKGRTAVINVYVGADTPFAASVTTYRGTKLIDVGDCPMFRDNASAVLDFFASRKPNVDRRESLMIRRILDAANDPKALKGFVRL